MWRYCGKDLQVQAKLRVGACKVRWALRGFNASVHVAMEAFVLVHPGPHDMFVAILGTPVFDKMADVESFAVGS